MSSCCEAMKYSCNQGRDCPVRKTCIGKHKYPSLGLAEMVTSRKQGSKLVAYKCDHCSFFHIGDAPTANRELRKAPK